MSTIVSTGRESKQQNYYAVLCEIYDFEVTRGERKKLSSQLMYMFTAESRKEQPSKFQQNLSSPALTSHTKKCSSKTVTLKEVIVNMTEAHKKS